LQRHLEARRAKGKGTPADAEGGVGGGCCGTVSSKWAKGTGGPAGDECYNLIAQPTAYRWQNDRDGLQQDDAVAALRASQGASGFHEMNHPVITQPVPYDLFQITAPVNRQNRAPGDPCHTLARDNAAHAAVAFTVDMQACKGNANVGDGSVSPTLCKPSGNDVHAVAFQQNQLGEVRCNTVAGTVNTNSNPSGRNTPMVAIGTDCYNGAITGDVAATMGTPGSSVNASGPTVMQAVAFPIDTQNMTEGHSSGGLGVGKSDDPSLTVTKGHSHAVAHAFYSTGGTHGVNQQPEVSPAVKVDSGLGIPSPPAVAVEALQQQGYDAPNACTQETNAVALLRSLRKEIGEEAFAAWGLGILDSLQPQEVLRSRLHGSGIRCATFSRSWPIDCAISREEDRAAWAMQSVREAKGEGCPSLGWQLPQQLATELGAYLSELPCPGAQTERFVRDLWLAGEGIGFLREALSAFQEARRPVVAAGQASAVMTVRRLTATECEFLQGFPRGWTMIPYRGKPPEQCPDGPRYKALGNSMACNAMAWIGERIAAYEAQNGST
jgi:hypothetical protein